MDEGERVLHMVDRITIFANRICPGKLFAERSLFMIVANALHALTISAPLGKDEKPVHMEGKMTEGVLS